LSPACLSVAAPVVPSPRRSAKANPPPSLAAVAGGVADAQLQFEGSLRLVVGYR